MSHAALNVPVAVVQMRPRAGDIRHNVAEMLYHIGHARKRGAKMVVFPEFAVSGYLLGDRWEDDSFIREIEAANETIRKASDGLVVVWGSVKADWHKIGEDGRVRKYNAAFVARWGCWQHTHNGKLVGWMPKTNLPKYRMFDDARHFYPAAQLAAEMGIPLEALLQPFDVLVPGTCFVLMLGVAICEDLWENEYNAKPSQIYAAAGADFIVDISQSPWTADKWKARDRMLRQRALDANCPILYVNAVGLQNNAKNLVWFDGGSCLVASDGGIRWMAALNRDHVDVINPARLLESQRVFLHPSGIEEKYDATLAAMQEFCAPIKRVVIGLSGGIDSAVSLAMHVRALGSSRVLAVNMPTQFNSVTTRSLASACAKNFDVEYRVVPIQEQYEARIKLLGEAGYTAVSDFDRENIQARIRGQVLADISACEVTRLGGRCMFTCNGNKTEVALNYFTLYGDGAGGSAFFSDFWKGEMYELAALINERTGFGEIPQGILDVVPSAELSANQNVEQGKGDPIFYPFHDKLLRAFIEWRRDPTSIIALACTGELEHKLGCSAGTIARYFPTRKALIDSIEWAWKQYSYEGKRHMLPPGFITSRRAFGFDRRETIAGEYFTDEYYRLRDAFLAQAA